MKNIIVLSIAFACLSLVSEVNCAKITVNVKATKESKDLVYTLQVLNSFSSYLKADTVYNSPDGKFELDLKPGVYTFNFLNPWSKTAKYYLYIEKANAEISLQVVLEPINIPEAVKSVSLTGNFNKFKKEGAIGFKYNENSNTWNVPKDSIPQDLESFRVIVNDRIWMHLPYQSLLSNLESGYYINKFDKQDIVFNPSEFSMDKTLEKISIKGSDERFNDLCKAVTTNWKLLMDSTSKIYNLVNKEKEVDVEALVNGYKNYYSQFEAKLDDRKNKYGESYKQFLIEVELEMLSYHPVNVKRNLFFRAKNTVKGREVENSEDYANFILRKAELIKNIDKKSNQLGGSFVNELAMLDYYCEDMDLYGKLGLSIGYFKQFKEDVLKETPNDEIKVDILMDKARTLARRDPDKALEMYKSIKTNYPGSREVRKGSVDKYIKGASVKVGTKAPDFVTKALDGKEIKLADYKGKYLFIDFWGTWCGPCKGEIPNVKKLNEYFKEGDLVVVGLMRDSEKAALKYIQEENILYTNAVVSDEILNNFGINSYPTTLLIDKEGNIIAKNLRGEGLVELVKKAIGQ